LQAFEYFIQHDDDLDGEIDTKGGSSMLYTVASEINDMEFIEGELSTCAWNSLIDNKKIQLF